MLPHTHLFYYILDVLNESETVGNKYWLAHDTNSLLFAAVSSLHLQNKLLCWVPDTRGHPQTNDSGYLDFLGSNNLNTPHCFSSWNPHQPSQQNQTLRTCSRFLCPPSLTSAQPLKPDDSTSSGSLFSFLFTSTVTALAQASVSKCLTR